MGVGMPQDILLDDFGCKVYEAFGRDPHLVGSALHGKKYRDVDIRLILTDEEYEALNLGDPVRGLFNSKWRSLCLAYSALGESMTGLPIDFQIQQMTFANKKYPHKKKTALDRETIGVYRLGDK